MTEDDSDSEAGPPLPVERPSGSATRDGDARTWTERYRASAGPNSPFYSPPPSGRALRWLLAYYLVSLALFTLAVVVAVLRSDSVVVAIGLLVLWVLFAWLRAYQTRRVLRELARRRAEGAGSPLQRGSGVDGQIGAEEQKRRRKAAWARVRHDVFPILSNPSALKRPFDKRNDSKD